MLWFLLQQEFACSSDYQPQDLVGKESIAEQVFEVWRFGLSTLPLNFDQFFHLWLPTFLYLLGTLVSLLLLLQKGSLPAYEMQTEV